MDLKSIKFLLKKHNLHPLKRLGQNFLIDKKVLRKIIETAQLGPDDIVLEIGPGIGNLTQELAKKAEKVIAVEKDPKMIEILKETLKDCKNVKIIQGDILKIKNGLMVKWLNGYEYKIVANLPYYIVSPVIRKFLESKNPAKEMVLMVQKEVAQRISARPPDMNVLAVSVQFYAKPEIISFISKKSFCPQPKVDSAIIKIIPFSKKQAIAGILPKQKMRDLFFKIVKAGFSQPRKQIVNNLAKMLKLEKGRVKIWLLKNNIQPSQRAETIRIKDWLNLSRSFPLF